MHLTVFVGPMFSGKTTRLLAAVSSLRAGGASVVLVKPDFRGGGADASAPPPAAVTARGRGGSLRADVLSRDLGELPVERGVTYAIDEAQFTGDALLPFAARVAAAAAAGAAAGARGERAGGLLVAGLDLDFARRPLGRVLDLAAAALDARGALGRSPAAVHRLLARCDRLVPPRGRGAAGGGGGAGAVRATCGAPAPFSQRLRGGLAAVQVDDGASYAPACAEHHSCDLSDAAEWAPGAGGGGPPGGGPAAGADVGSGLRGGSEGGA